MQDVGCPDTTIDSLDAARALLGRLLARAEAERLYVAHLRRDGRLIRLRVRNAAMGRQIDFPLRTIVTDALNLGSAALILAHNHPSGDPTPSSADIDATRSLIRAARPLGIAVSDHLVFAGESFVSFRQRGLL
ncbi:DNA repair protein [Sphingomonas sp. ID1715]|uniref:JAB domain-containing protein n=1 Tax=Sphingomonas sp. ID1715 TaxID=1656898 RepID=UPI0014881F69|nr:JAB domain-containing protein [Sphingomonas sp. ID1715]NNM76940.1 DNA repair protein [Sphingomonas sp. ID1715]